MKILVVFLRHPGCSMFYLHHPHMEGHTPFRNHSARFRWVVQVVRVFTVISQSTYGGMGEGVIQEQLRLLRVTRSGDFAQKNDLEISSFLRKARETKFSALSEFTVFFVQNLRYQGKFET